LGFFFFFLVVASHIAIPGVFPEFSDWLGDQNLGPKLYPSIRIFEKSKKLKLKKPSCSKLDAEFNGTKIFEQILPDPP